MDPKVVDDLKKRQLAEQTVERLKRSALKPLRKIPLYTSMRNRANSPDLRTAFEQMHKLIEPKVSTTGGSGLLGGPLVKTRRKSIKFKQLTSEVSNWPASHEGELLLLGFETSIVVSAYKELNLQNKVISQTETRILVRCLFDVNNGEHYFFSAYDAESQEVKMVKYPTFEELLAAMNEAILGGQEELVFYHTVLRTTDFSTNY